MVIIVLDTVSNIERAFEMIKTKFAPNCVGNCFIYNIVFLCN